MDEKLIKYIDKNFPGLLRKLLKQEKEDRKESKIRKAKYKSIDDYIWNTSAIIPFKSKEGNEIYMNEVSFHMLNLMFPDEKFIDRWIDTTGAFSTSYDLIDDSVGYLICINSDVYDNLSENMDYIKYFTIAHEIGHCLNDDMIHPLNLDHSITSTEKRMEVKECIKRELNADKTGYEEVIYTDWFGDFKFNPKLTLTVTYRRYQHVCNWLYCTFGNMGVGILKLYFQTNNLLDIGSKFLDLTVYKGTSTEDKKRRKLFEKYFC